jgi:hypothetical protein
MLGGLQCTGGRGDPTSVKEELHWLLLMSGHVLADSGDGETPLVPESISALNVSSADPANHPAVLLFQLLIWLARAWTQIYAQRFSVLVLWRLWFGFLGGGWIHI